MVFTRGSRDIPAMLEGLVTTPDRLESLTAGVDDAALDAAPDGEWSARVVLAHLRDDEYMLMRPRMVRIVVEAHPTLVPFDERAWAASRWKGRDALPQLLEDFRMQREASMMMLRRLEGDDWQRTGLQPEYGVFDAHWWLEHWLDHDENHLAQIESVLGWANS